MNQYLGITYNGIVLAEHDPAVVQLKRLFPGGFSLSWDPVYEQQARIPVDCAHMFIDLAVLERRLFASVGVFRRREILKIKRSTTKYSGV